MLNDRIKDAIFRVRQDHVAGQLGGLERSFRELADAFELLEKKLATFEHVDEQAAAAYERLLGRAVAAERRIEELTEASRYRSRHRYAWGQGRKDFADCQIDIICDMIIDGVEGGDKADFVDTKTLEYRIISYVDGAVIKTMHKAKHSIEMINVRPLFHRTTKG